MYILKKYHPVYGRQGHRYTNSEFNTIIPDKDRKFFEWMPDDAVNDDLYEPELMEELDIELA